jgi:AAA15 family ATPase/GTPase
MIKSVEINNFKSLSHFDISNLGQINLFGGKNNAGKTTFLEALFLLFDRTNPQSLLRQYNWRGVGEISITPEVLFSPIFKDFDLRKTIQIRLLHRNSQTESLTIEFNNNHNRMVRLEGNEGQIKTGSNIISTHALEFQYRKNEGKVQKANIILEPNGFGMELVEMNAPEKRAIFLASKSHVSPHENAVHYGELDIKGKTQTIIDSLKFIEPNLKGITSVALQNGTSMLYGEVGIGQKVPIPYMGDGTSRLLTILLSIVSNKDGIVFIDEIENGIHYSILNKLWHVIATVAKENNCQVFATTHSYECLGAAVKGIPTERQNEFKYFRLEKSKNTYRSVAKEFNFEMLQAAVERGWEVR